MEHWEPFQFDGRLLTDIIQAMHRASQVMAMVSHAYSPHRQDDSHNALKWNMYTKTLEGCWIDEAAVQIKLDALRFELIADRYDQVNHLKLIGKTTDQIIAWVKKQLASVGLEPKKLVPIKHFEVPGYAAFDNPSAFPDPEHHLLNEWTNYFDNTQILLKEFQQQHKWSSEVRVWPHHFDIGLYIPVERDGSGSDTKSIGVGLAIPDQYSAEPYFYINHWSKNSIVYPDVLPETRFGYWNKKNWTGLILPAGAVLLQKDQEIFVRKFFQSGIGASLQLLNYKSSEFIE